MKNRLAGANLASINREKVAAYANRKQNDSDAGGALNRASRLSGSTTVSAKIRIENRSVSANASGKTRRANFCFKTN